ncbi:MAG: LA_1612 family putative O-antigen biosynthesis protein, partial [Ilumatobacteraceae bacterium]
MKAFLQFLQRAYKYFRSTKRVWRRPPRASLLIIDRGTASPLDEMFAHHNPHIMEIRGESVNMFALLRALPKIHLGAVAYLEAYIDFVKPKLILSRTDNNHTLWQLKRRPNVTYKVALVQNGWRLTVDFEIPALLSSTSSCGDWEIDRLFAFGSAWASQIPGHVRFKAEINGSSKANEFSFSRKSERNGVGFISSYRPTIGKRQNYLDVSVHYQYLDNKISDASRDLIIVANTKKSESEWAELNYYSESFVKSNWTLSSRDFSSSSYQKLQNVECVIVESSSLGYECLGMGMRVGFIAFRPQHRQDRRFGKPLEFGEKGPFWT